MKKKKTIATTTLEVSPAEELTVEDLLDFIGTVDHRAKIYITTYAGSPIEHSSVSISLRTETDPEGNPA